MITDVNGFTQNMIEWHNAEVRASRANLAIVASLMFFAMVAVPLDWLTLIGAMPAVACIRWRMVVSQDLKAAREAYWMQRRRRNWEKYGVTI